MSDYICTRRIEYLRTFIYLGEPEQESEGFELTIVFVFMKGWKSTILVLIALEPAIGPIYFLFIELKQLTARIEGF